MTDRFTEFTELAATGETRLNWRHRILNPDGGVEASTDAGDGGVQWGAEIRPLLFDNKGVSSRLAQLSVPATDMALIPDAEGLLHPDSGYLVSMEAGVVVDGVESWQTQATMLVEDVTADDDSSVSLNVSLVDTTDPIRSNLVNSFAWDTGDLVTGVIDRLIGQVVDNYRVAGASFTAHSGSLGPGDSRERALIEFLDSIGHELTATPEGLPITRPIISSADDPAAPFWRYGQEDGIPIGRARRVWSRRTPEGVRVEGGSFQDPDQPVTITVYDTDPASAGYFSGAQEAQIRTLRAPFITSILQAVEAGFGQLRRHGVGPMMVEIWSTPNPGIREGDLVELYRPQIKAEGRFRVIGYQLPLQVDGMMSLTLRKVFEPAVNFVPPNPAIAGCVTTFSDGFNRNVPNLEDLPPNQPGSPDWEEISYSWGIETWNGNRVAEQRYGGTGGQARGWSMGMVKAPTCDSNHYAEMVIVDLPSNTAAGPAVRATPSYDGYMMHAYPSGRIAIERWHNYAMATTLTSVQYGSVVGTTMRLEAVGRTITGYINGSQILSVTDDAATGSHIGMSGRGGYHPNGPKASSFSGGVL